LTYKTKADDMLHHWHKCK